MSSDVTYLDTTLDISSDTEKLPFSATLITLYTYTASYPTSTKRIKTRESLR